MQKFLTLCTILLVLISVAIADDMWYYTLESEITEKDIENMNFDWEPSEEDDALMGAWETECINAAYTSGENIYPDLSKEESNKAKQIVWFVSTDDVMNQDKCSNQNLYDAVNKPINGMYRRDIFKVHLAKIGVLDVEGCVDETNKIIFCRKFFAWKKMKQKKMKHNHISPVIHSAILTAHSKFQQKYPIQLEFIRTT